MTSNGGQGKDVDNQVGEGREVASDPSTQPSPAEDLATSILQFVTSAALLGTTLCSVAAENVEEEAASFQRSQQGEKSITESNKATLENSEAFRDESQVQLMRLRVKSREIIIYPDPQYLCCVVQKTGKQVGTADA